MTDLKAHENNNSWRLLIESTEHMFSTRLLHGQKTVMMLVEFMLEQPGLKTRSLGLCLVTIQVCPCHQFVLENCHVTSV